MSVTFMGLEIDGMALQRAKAVVASRRPLAPDTHPFVVGEIWESTNDDGIRWRWRVIAVSAAGGLGTLQSVASPWAKTVPLTPFQWNGDGGWVRLVSP